MFSIKTSFLKENKIVKYEVLKNNESLSFKEVILYWKIDNVFNDFFSEVLATSDFSAFFWELPPMTSTKLDLPFEFVLVKSDSLVNISADRKAFRNYFSKKESIVSFPNIRGDAQLVVPCPIAENDNYPHLAQFIRHAPTDQKRNLWKTLADAYEIKIGIEPVWLSTAGLGVSWLHIRIDSRPKYYRYSAYKASNYF